jgi:hypothetical protein
MADFVALGFELAFKYRNSGMILTVWSDRTDDGEGGFLEFRRQTDR